MDPCKDLVFSIDFGYSADKLRTRRSTWLSIDHDHLLHSPELWNTIRVFAFVRLIKFEEPRDSLSSRIGSCPKDVVDFANRTLTIGMN